MEVLESQLVLPLTETYVNCSDDLREHLKHLKTRPSPSHEAVQLQDKSIQNVQKREIQEISFPRKYCFVKIASPLLDIWGLLTLQAYMHSINAQFIYKTRELLRVKMFVYLLCAPPVSLVHTKS